MSLFKRLFGAEEAPKVRTRICIECGMPVAEHKDWCAIRRGHIEMAERAASAEGAIPSN